MSDQTPPVPDDASSSREVIELSRESVEWMRKLHPTDWTEVGEAWPSECFRPLIWLGLVERDGDEPRFRLTEMGWWALDTDMIVGVE